jgi:hypothetical protein
MNLTPPQRDLLVLFAHWKDRPPTVGGLFLRNWTRYLVLLAFAAVGCGFLWYRGLDTAGWFVLGMIVGAIFRDVGTFRRMVRNWPVEAEVLDWRRVEELSARPDPLA